ncbi:hypothetical protein NPIL_279311, partial [Nephila pilipes]
MSKICQDPESEVSRRICINLDNN